MSDEQGINPEFEKYGRSIGVPHGDGYSRWYRGELIIKRINYIPIWFCPIDGGEMKYTGFMWLTAPEGRHYECDRCGFQAAVTREELREAKIKCE